MKFSYPKGATPLDPNEAEGLLLTHITTQAELNRWEQDNINEALAWLDQRKPRDVLDGSFIRRLHTRMFGGVWKWAGEFRKSNKNLGVPWHQIPVELRKLLDDSVYWIENDTFHPDEIAARFHQRLVSIHLFPNGNGRHARLMTDLLLEINLHQSRFTWGTGDLVSQGNVRQKYIDALLCADKGDLEPLIQFARS